MTVYRYALQASIATTTGVDIGIGGTSTLVQGEDVELEFTVFETEDHESTVDLSSASSIEWVLRADDGTQVTTKTQSGGGITFDSDGSDGVVVVELDGGDTSGEDATSYQHQLGVTDSNSERSVVARGELNLAEDYA